MSSALRLMISPSDQWSPLVNMDLSESVDACNHQIAAQQQPDTSSRLNGTNLGLTDSHTDTNVAAELGTPFDFVRSYADYADVLEVPRILHELVGIELVGATLNPNIRIPHGAVTLSLDLWILLLSGSGAGRSTTLGMAAPVIAESGLTELISSVRWGSGPAVYQHYAEHPHGLQVWGEMSERLKLLNQRNFAGVKEWLTDCYDNWTNPAPHHYRVTRKTGDTPPIVFNEAPRINILTSSSESWFFGNLAEADSMGGFLPRFLIFRIDSPRRDVPIPRKPDPALLVPLGQRLAAISLLRGEADLSNILTLYEPWYSATKSRFISQSNSALAMAFFHRHRNHVVKLAVIFEASQSETLKVSERSWDRAVAFAAHVEQSLFGILSTGMNAQGFLINRIEEKIRQGGRSGLSKNVITRSFQSIPARDREDHLRTLEEAGRIYRGAPSLESSRGRPRILYVHESFVNGVA